MMSTMACWYFVTLFLFLILLPSGWSLSPSSLDSTIADYAFNSLLRGRQTGVLYQVPLPSNMSGIKASVLRIRSSSLWTKGIDSGTFHIPPRTISVPYVRRMVIVFQDLGNWSSSYLNVSGYSLAGNVVGCLAYDASNNVTTSNSIRGIGLRPIGDLGRGVMSISFPGVTPPARCVRFGKDKQVHIGGTTSRNICEMKSTGHFAMVVPLNVSVAPPPRTGERGERRWWLWVVVVGCGVVGFVLVGLVGVVMVRLARRKKREVMEVHAEKDEALGSVMVGGSKMPSATMVRTQPELENGNAPF